MSIDAGSPGEATFPATVGIRQTFTQKRKFTVFATKAGKKRHLVERGVREHGQRAP